MSCKAYSSHAFPLCHFLRNYYFNIWKCRQNSREINFSQEITSTSDPLSWMANISVGYALKSKVKFGFFVHVLVFFSVWPLHIIGQKASELPLLKLRNISISKGTDIPECRAWTQDCSNNLLESCSPKYYSPEELFYPKGGRWQTCVNGNELKLNYVFTGWVSFLFSSENNTFILLTFILSVKFPLWISGKGALTWIKHWFSTWLLGRQNHWQTGLECRNQWVVVLSTETIFKRQVQCNAHYPF